MNDYITEPGKFEGQALWVPKAYDLSLDGGWDEYGDLEHTDYHYCIGIVSEEMKNWNLDPNTYAVVIEEDSQGFVDGFELTESDYETLMADLYSGCRDDLYEYLKI